MEKILRSIFGAIVVLSFTTPVFSQAGGGGGGGGSNGGPCEEPGLKFNMFKMWGFAKNNTPQPPWPEWDGACSYTMDAMAGFHEETQSVGTMDSRTYRVKIKNFLEEYHDVMGETEHYQSNIDFDYEQEFTYTAQNDGKRETEGTIKEIYTVLTGGLKNGVVSNTFQTTLTNDSSGADPWIKTSEESTGETLYIVAVAVGVPVAYTESKTVDRHTTVNFDGGESKEYEYDFFSSKAKDQVSGAQLDGDYSKLAQTNYYDPDTIGGLKDKVERKLGNIAPWRASNITAIDDKVETTVNYRSNGRRSSASVEVEAGGVSSTLSVEWADVAMAPPINITLDGEAKTEAEANAWLSGTAVPAAADFHISGCPFLTGTVQGLGSE